MDHSFMSNRFMGNRRGWRHQRRRRGWRRGGAGSRFQLQLAAAQDIQRVRRARIRRRGRRDRGRRTRHAGRVMMSGDLAPDNLGFQGPDVVGDGGQTRLQVRRGVRAISWPGGAGTRPGRQRTRKTSSRCLRAMELL